jgi:hypothetical protein
MEKKVTLKLRLYEGLALCKFTDTISSTQPGNTDFQAKLIIAVVRLVRKKLHTSLLTHKLEYRIVLAEHEALALSQAMLLMPVAMNVVDDTVLDKIQTTIHQKLV